MLRRRIVISWMNRVDDVTRNYIWWILAFPLWMILQEKTNIIIKSLIMNHIIVVNLHLPIHFNHIIFRSLARTFLTQLRQYTLNNTSIWQRREIRHSIPLPIKLNINCFIFADINKVTVNMLLPKRVIDR